MRKIYDLLKTILTLDNKRYFIVSSLSYYLIISLIPFLTLSQYFNKLFNFETTYNLYLPSNNIFNIFSTLISIYISSKGILNYYFYINEKFELPKLKYDFILSKIYVIIITIILCFCFSLINVIKSFLPAFFQWFFYIIFLFLLLLFGNYFLLRKKIPLDHLGIGSFVSSILLSSSTFIFQLITIYFKDKKKYYGGLTNFIILLFFMYVISYFIIIGSQINYLFHKNNN